MLAAIHLIVKDGEKYIRKCLQSVLNQDFQDFEILVFDNDSRDKTREIVEEISRISPIGPIRPIRLIRWDKNYGLGGGFNRSLQYSGYPMRAPKPPSSSYVVLLCVDVILAPNFLSEAVKIMESDPKIGALQPKVLQWDFQNNRLTDVIDTTGFEIFQSRRVINRGHGEKDIGQYQEGEVFSYEGACPIFKRQMLEDVGYKVKDVRYECLDEDFGWYADDVDLGWRMRLFGWKSYFSPKVVAWHDRQTTKTLKKSLIDFIITRRQIPWRKRMLDWRNQRLAMVKNEIGSHFLKELPYFLKREIPLLAYFFFFEPGTFWLGIFGFFKLLPKMLEKRRYIMKNRKVKNSEIQKWFF